MQRCRVCGYEFPDNARFCGTCGRAPTSSTALNTAAPSFMPAPEQSVYTMATTSLPQGNQFAREDEEEKRRRGAFLPLPAPFGTEGSLPGGQAPLVQGTPSFSSVPAVQGTPPGMAGSVPPSNLAGPAPSTSYIAPSPGQQVSFGPQPSSWANQPTPHYAHPTDIQSHEPPEHEHPDKQHHHHHEHHQHHLHKSTHNSNSAVKSATGGITKTILIITIGVVVVAVSASAFAFRSHFPGFTAIFPATSSNSSNHSANTNACGVSTGISCPVTTSTSSSVASGQSTGTFNFSGAVSGTMMITSFPACGVTQGNTYVMQVIGAVGGTQYKFLIGILSYKGPGTYTSQLTVNLIRGSGANVGELGNDGRFPVTITITNGGNAGTVSSDMEGTLSLSDVQVSKGHVSANWTCG